MRYNDYKNEEFSRCNCTPPYTAEAGEEEEGHGTFGLYSLANLSNFLSRRFE
jgi:hypothetical protein